MAKSIKKNFLYNLSYQILSICLPIITAPYLARVIGVEGVGVSSFTISIVAYFILVSNLGISSFGQREIAMHQDDKKAYSKVFWDLAMYRFIIGGLTVIAYIFLIIFSDRYQMLYLILLLSLVGDIFSITWLYQGLEEYKYISLRNIIIKIFFTLSIFIFVKTPDDLPLYILLYSLSVFVSPFVLWARLPKVIEKINFKKLRPFRYAKDTLIYFLPQIATTIYTVLDRTMLGLFDRDQIENGYYEQAYKIISVATSVVTALNVVVAPRIAFLYKKDNVAEIKERLRKSMRFVNLLSIPLVFGIMATASTIVPWFFGEGYEKVMDILPIFAPIILIIALSGCLGGQCLTPCGKRLSSAIALWVGAGLNLLCNLIFIPRLMSTGAVIGSLVAETTITTAFFWLARKYVNFFITIKDALKYFTAAILMYIVVVIIKGFLPPTIPTTIIEVLVGASVYGIVLIILRDKMVFEYMGMMKEKFLKRGKK